MSEPTLGMSYADLVEAVASYLGMSTTTASRTSAENATLDRLVQIGLRRFYVPPSVDGRPPGYEWSFLRAQGVIQLVSGTDVYPLPADLANIHGQMNFDRSSGWWGAPVISATPEWIRDREQQSGNSYPGRPTHYATRMATVAHASQGSRREIVFFPTPNLAATLHFQYTRRGLQKLEDGLYPLGGTTHAETIRASVLAAAELEMNDMRGDRESYFREQLAASIWADLQAQPIRYGYNDDMSDGRGHHFIRTTPVTFED